MHTRTAIGKRFTPHESTRCSPGNHHYCFVDFETKPEAEAARQALNGRLVNGNKLKVALAKGMPQKLVDRRTDVGYGHTESDGGDMRSNNPGSKNLVVLNRSIQSM